MIQQGDFVTAVIGSKETTRLKHGTVINNPVKLTFNYETDQINTTEEPFVAIKCWWSNKLIFAHTDNVVLGYYT